MFEYNNQQLSMEALQQGAVDAGMDFDEYFNRLTALGMVEKQEEVVEESNLVSDTEDYSFELPQVTMKDVDVPEVQAINRFKKKFAGLGFDFENNERIITSIDPNIDVDLTLIIGKDYHSISPIQSYLNY